MAQTCAVHRGLVTDLRLPSEEVTRSQACHLSWLSKAPASALAFQLFPQDKSEYRSCCLSWLDGQGRLLAVGAVVYETGTEGYGTAFPLA